jgi:hypothetical protein
MPLPVTSIEMVDWIWQFHVIPRTAITILSPRCFSTTVIGSLTLVLPLYPPMERIGCGHRTWVTFTIVVGNRSTNPPSSTGAKSVRSGHLSYHAEVPKNSELIFGIRSAASPGEIERQAWREIKSGSFSLKGEDRYLQYRATLKSHNGDLYPILDRVSITLAP